MMVLARKMKVMDRPNSRKIHRVPKGRLGGVAIYVGVMVSLLPSAVYFELNFLPYIVSGFLIFVVGLLDDIYELNPLLKLSGQLAAAIALVWFGVNVEVISGFKSGTFFKLGILKMPLTIFWLIAITNMINFLDGLDGLAATMVVITSFTLILVNLCDKISIPSIFMLTALAGSSLGFLRYNWHPAQIFMGDSGSMFLGFSLGVSSVLGAFKGATIAIVMVPFMVLLIPIYDIIFAVVRRISKDRPIFKPDREHIHHQFLKLGFRHERVVMLLSSISALLGVSAVFISATRSIYAVFYLVGLALILAIGLIVFLKFAKPCDRI
jgi:UDP-GlcNAc:undecaprenyl-phosphate GlcNAc-1-phosphate transferase